jgi:hypothetical protein
MLATDYSRIEIGTEETPATDYYHLRLLNSWQLRLQRHKLYVGSLQFVHFGLIIKFVLLTGLAPLVESMEQLHIKFIFN